jgi:hypothetical protein
MKSTKENLKFRKNSSSSKNSTNKSTLPKGKLWSLMDNSKQSIVQT